MIKEKYAIVINRPLDVVYDYLVTPDLFSQWQTEIEDVQVDKEGPLAVGHIISETRMVAGIKVTTSRVVTYIQKNDGIRLESASDAIFPFTAGSTVREVEGGVEVAIEYELEIGGIFAAAEKSVARQVGKNTLAGLERLKDILESQG